MGEDGVKGGPKDAESNDAEGVRKVLDAQDIDRPAECTHLSATIDQKTANVDHGACLASEKNI